MAIVVLDTNVLIGLWHNNKVTIEQLPNFKNKKLCISICTYVEFLAATPQKYKASTRKFLNKFEVIPFTSTSIQAAKSLAFTFQTPASQFIDLLIAANATGIKAPIYTNNIKDFEKFNVTLL